MIGEKNINDVTILKQAQTTTWLATPTKPIFSPQRKIDIARARLVVKSDIPTTIGFMINIPTNNQNQTTIKKCNKKGIGRIPKAIKSQKQKIAM